MIDPDRVAAFLLKPVARACKEFDLLAEEDRVAVAVSGGKDSRALLDLLLRYRGRVPYAYELIALHIVATVAGFSDRSAERSRRSLRPELEPWFRELDVEYHFAPLELHRTSHYRSIAFAARGTGARHSSPLRSNWAAISWPSATTPTTRPLRRS